MVNWKVGMVIGRCKNCFCEIEIRQPRLSQIYPGVVEAISRVDFEKKGNEESEKKESRLQERECHNMISIHDYLAKKNSGRATLDDRFADPGKGKGYDLL